MASIQSVDRQMRTVHCRGSYLPLMLIPSIFEYPAPWQRMVCASISFRAFLNCLFTLNSFWVFLERNKTWKFENDEISGKNFFGSRCNTFSSEKTEDSGRPLVNPLGGREFLPAAKAASSCRRPPLEFSRSLHPDKQFCHRGKYQGTCVSDELAAEMPAGTRPLIYCWVGYPRWTSR